MLKMAGKCSDMVLKLIKGMLFLALFVIIFSVCRSESKTSFEIDYDHLFFKIKFNSIKRNEINWTVLEKKVKDSIKVFATRKDYDRAVKYTLRLVDDHHSHFFDSESENPFLDRKLKLPELETKIIGNNIAYIKIPGFGANDSISKLFSIKIREALSLLDQRGNLSGWIIDVRGNTGGSAFMFPLGISPLMHDSVIIYSKNNRGKSCVWKCVNSQYYMGNHKITVIPACSGFINKDKPIAVLTDSLTASGGELTTLILKSRKSTRSFGSKTRGATSSLISIDVINKKEKYHSQLLLASQNWYDKDNHLINGKLTPDVECLPQNSLDSAICWIEKEDHYLLADKSAKEKAANKVD